jgi:hypothetical protein
MSLDQHTMVVQSNQFRWTRTAGARASGVQVRGKELSTTRPRNEGRAMSTADMLRKYCASD